MKRLKGFGSRASFLRYLNWTKDMWGQKGMKRMEVLSVVVAGQNGRIESVEGGLNCLSWWGRQRPIRDPVFEQTWTDAHYLDSIVVLSRNPQDTKQELNRGGGRRDYGSNKKWWTMLIMKLGTIYSETLEHGRNKGTSWNVVSNPIERILKAPNYRIGKENFMLLLEIFLKIIFTNYFALNVSGS